MRRDRKTCYVKGSKPLALTWGSYRAWHAMLVWFFLLLLLVRQKREQSDPFFLGKSNGKGAGTWNSCIKMRIYDHLDVCAAVQPPFTTRLEAPPGCAFLPPLPTQCLFWVFPYKLTCPTLKNKYLFLKKLVK